MNFILTIDTEADNQWEHGRELTVDNIRYIPRFQELCRRYKVKPTYLVTSEICEDRFARDLFSDYISTDSAEIGAHLHPWTTPPFMNRDGLRYNDPNHAFASELPHDMLANKLRYLTDQIGTAFGKLPVSFRSGRYGFNENVARLLAMNRYLVDSSVTPYMSWSDFAGIPGNKGGPDFVDKRPFPYTYTFNDRMLLEIPVTIMPTKFPLRYENILTDYYFRNRNKNFIFKVIREAFFRDQPLWLRPSPSMSIGMLDNVLDEALRKNLPYAVMMFHSSELMPGCSIFRTDKESIEKLYELLEKFFELLNIKNISSMRLGEAARHYTEVKV